MMLHAQLHLAQERLASVADNPRLEAEILLAYVLQKPRTYLHAWPDTRLSQAALDKFVDCIQKRCGGEPIAYITGRREFWSLDLQVNKHTLIPRPETELLVETTLSLFGASKPVVAADLGTGSGAIAIALAHERRNWQVLASDISAEALSVAKQNAAEVGLQNLTFYQGSWCEALPKQRFDAIISNPPYLSDEDWTVYGANLACEPKAALVSGKDGLEAIRELVNKTPAYLKPGGYLLIEHGFSQGQQVRELLVKAGFSAVHTVCDLSAQERITLGRADS